ncbi:MAG: LamG-like jellyroll fold domain-containing protein [Bacteroidota bacterium]
MGIKISSLFFSALLYCGTLFSQPEKDPCKPVLLLHFNGNAQDASGLANHGTVVGATLTYDRYGNVNSAYQFDGVDDHIVIADHSSLDLDTTWTIMAWIKPKTGYGSFQNNHISIVDKWGNAGKEMATYIMGIHTNGELEGLTHTGSAGTYQWSDSIISENVWTHVAVTRSKDDSIRLYINFVLVKTYRSVIPQNSKFDLLIGMHADPASRLAYPSRYRFHGVIDEVKIYRCALFTSQFSLDVDDVVNHVKSIEIFPNPSAGIIQIKQDFTESFEVKIYDMKGQVVIASQNLNTLSIVAAPGLYLLQFRDLTTGSIINKKITLVN